MYITTPCVHDPQLPYTKTHRCIKSKRQKLDFSSYRSWQGNLISHHQLHQTNTPNHPNKQVAIFPISHNNHLSEGPNSFKVKMQYLVGLSNISKDHIHHTNKHSVLHWMPSIFDDGDHVCTLLRHVHKITPAPMRKFHCVHYSSLHSCANISNIPIARP
jgi:hypothetical protein